MCPTKSRCAGAVLLEHIDFTEKFSLHRFSSICNADVLLQEALEPAFLDNIINQILYQSSETQLNHLGIIYFLVQPDLFDILDIIKCFKCYILFVCVFLTFTNA